MAHQYYFSFFEGFLEVQGYLLLRAFQVVKRFTQKMDSPSSKGLLKKIDVDTQSSLVEKFSC